MPSASYQPASSQRGTPLRRRITAFLLALAAHVVVILLLLRLAPSPSPPRVEQQPPSTFQMMPEPSAAPEPAPRKTAVAKVRRASESAPPSPAARAVAPPPPLVPPPVPPPLMAGGMELFDAADISKLPSHRDEGDAGAGGAGRGKDSASVYGPGEGPGGERLYDVDWYRKPTQAELSYYLPPNAPVEGYALIACRMVADYRVENCRALSESPIGSGLARAMRLAAWQFRVLPPRIGGRMLLGSWVRIRIDFGTRAAK